MAANEARANSVTQSTRLRPRAAVPATITDALVRRLAVQESREQPERRARAATSSGKLGVGSVCAQCELVGWIGTGRKSEQAGLANVAATPAGWARG